MSHTSADYTGAFWEYVALDGTPGLGEGTSLAHGWSSGPTSALSKYVLGVQPTQPGYTSWLVEPQVGDLQWAKGAVPTPYGPIKVNWQAESHGIGLRITALSGTQGSVGLPMLSSSYSLVSDGRPAKTAHTADALNSFNLAGRRPGYVYVNKLNGGTHNIVLNGK